VSHCMAFMSRRHIFTVKGRIELLMFVKFGGALSVVVESTVYYICL